MKSGGSFKSAMGGDEEEKKDENWPADGAKKDPSMGPVDISSLTRVSKDDLGMMAQPAEPKFKLALLQVTESGRRLTRSKLVAEKQTNWRSWVI